MLDSEGRQLTEDFARLFARGVAAPLPDSEFGRLARRLFAYQFKRNAPYAAYCRRQGKTPETVAHWSQIPAVPAAAFKELPLASGAPENAELVFRSSGTTRGDEERAFHYVPDRALYRAAVVPNLAAYLFPEGRRLEILSLVPAASESPDSSLSVMVDFAIEEFGAEGSGYYISNAGGLDPQGLAVRLRAAERDERPVCIMGTAFAFVHWTDGLRERGESFRLPPGSRLMDTGGFKGRSREVAADELRDLYSERLDIPPDHCVNEYGMTELCSQFYDNVLRDRLVRGAVRERHKVPPPWVRVRLVHPETLEPVATGGVGLLRVVDLANVGSVLAVQTEDVGWETAGGFVVHGRAPGSAARGCSLAMDMLLEAQRDRG